MLIDDFNFGSLVALYGKSQKSSEGKKADIRSGNTLFNTITVDIAISGVFMSNKLSFETDII